MVREAAVLQKTAREAAARLRTEPAAAAKSGAASPSEIVSPAQISVSAENLSTESSSEAGDSSTDASQSTEEDSTSMKGIKAAGDLLISGGSFTIDSADDSIHSNSSVTIKDGVFEIASGDDAAHADEDLTVVAGTMNISESYEGLEALHLEIQDGDITLTASDDGLNAAGGTDSSGIQGGRDGMFGGERPGFSSSDGTITISGGTFIGTGASGMAQTFSDAQQGVISVSVGEQSAGTEVTLTDSSGNVILDVTPDLSFTVVILSSPELMSGESYTLTVGTDSEAVEAEQIGK